MKKISIAVATYNGEKYIEEQLLSIYNQSVKPFEVVIIDDGSSDNTVYLTEKFISTHNLKNWQIIRNEENLGFIKNFKKAISLTSGDIIFLCDQDDVWNNNKLKRISEIFENEKVCAVSSSFKAINSSGEVIKESQPQNFGLISMPINGTITKIPIKTVMHCNISPGCTSAFRREVAQIYLENTKSVLPHDFEINLIAAARDGLFFINEPLVYYRLHSSNTLGLNYKKQTRLEIAEEKLKAAEVLATANSDCYKYLSVCTSRLEALKHHNFLKAIKLNFNMAYRTLYSFKERAGDLTYIVRGS
ncbi:MAG: glycosyltransferase family 2 protein [Clostridia bacterium]|nr:glycosyltransferase family 2 protein [Clostridia bacterium]